MEANGFEKGENSTMNHPLITFLSSQTLTMNPTNPNFSIVSKDSHESTEPEDQSLGSQDNSGYILRGKPHGSKTNIKPDTILINKECPNSLLGGVLKIFPGGDLIEVLTAYANQNHCGVVVMDSCGVVKDVTIRSLVVPEGVITFPGDHHILSLHGAFFPSLSPPMASGLTIYLSGEQGVLGGIAVGRLEASGPVEVVVGCFNNAAFHRLPVQVQMEQHQDTHGLYKRKKTSGASSPSSAYTGPPSEGPQAKEGFVGESMPY